MHSRITTTVTTLVDLETFEPRHDVEISAEDDLPQQVIMLAVQGALRSALKAVETREPRVVEVDDDE